MTLYLTAVVACVLHIGYGLLELQSMQVVSCANKNVCHDGKNLRIVLKASAIETTEGEGSISGVVTGGQTWTDLHGNWELAESLNININYQNAIWEYQLKNEGTFWTKAEQFCAPFMTPCNSYDDFVECPNKNNFGLALVDASECTKYGINVVEKWDASVTIQSTHLNMEWDASNLQHTIWNTNAEVSLDSAFDTTSCYQDLSSQYYVVVPSSGNQYFYFIAKDYWQDARNNFNISAETWKRDFDCNFEWTGWHTIIPFYASDSDYQALAEDGDSNPRLAMANNQLHAWSHGYIPAFYVEVMNALTGECTDLTTFTDALMEARGPPAELKYKVAKLEIVDHFEMILDLDYTQFVQMPTSAPTPNPTQTPTVEPTGAPSNSPTETPSHTPTSIPTNQPTPAPTDAVADPIHLYEIPAKLEISSAAHINISSPTVQDHIIQSIASGLNYGREYIRLDTADVMTSTTGRRRLQTNTESLLLEFTIFTNTEQEQSAYSAKLETTSTYHFILAAITRKIPHVLSIFVANILNDCPVGTKQITIAGQRRCQSICLVNQYYDTSSSSCKDQVDFSSTITTTVHKNTLGRMMYFGLGAFGWIVTLGLMRMMYRYCINRKLGAAVNKTSNKSKQYVENAVYSIGSTEDEASEYGESEFDSMTRKFTAKLGDTVKSAKQRLSRKQHKNDKIKRDNKPLLDDESNETSEGNTSSSGDEYSSESELESDSESRSASCSSSSTESTD